VKASANVLVKDNLGNPTSGVTVQAQITGSWNYQSVSAVTGSDGIAVIISSTKKASSSTFQVCVNNLQPSGSLWYNSSANKVTCG
jgi:hypothetical protein